MSEKNELNDIILNKGTSSGSNKKIILAVATLGVVLIIVVMLMSTLTPDAKDNLPQPIPLPVQEVQSIVAPQDEPLFEDVEIIEEDSANNESLDKIAQKLKEESLQEVEVTEVVAIPQPKKVVTPKKKPAKVVAKPKPTPAPVAKATSGKGYFIQVGSFAKFAPNKKFLDSITGQGYKYEYKKIKRNSKTLTKVLVGPFYNESEARTALRNIRSKIEAGAFLVKP